MANIEKLWEVPIQTSVALGKKLLGMDDKKPKAAPAPAEPTVMPTADSKAIKKARQRSAASQMRRRGRASTILTPQSDKLGG